MSSNPDNSYFFVHYNKEGFEESDPLAKLNKLERNNHSNPFRINSLDISFFAQAVPKILARCDELFKLPVAEATPTQ